MKNLYRIMAIILAISMLPAFSVALADDSTYYYESFDSYITNSSPTELTLNTEKYYIKEYGKNNKALAVFGDKSTCTLTVLTAITGSFVLSFDISCISNAVDGTLTFNDGSRSVDFLKFTSDNRINAYNGKHLFGYSKNNISSVAIAYNADYNTCDFYRNGKCVEKDFRLKTSSLSGLSEFYLSFTPSNPGEGLIIDNIYAAPGTKLPKKLPASEYNEEAQEEPEFTYGVKVGNKVIVNTDFEAPAITQQVHKNSSTIELFKETEDNTAVLFERLSMGDFHLTAQDLSNIDSDCLVLEYDLKVLAADSYFEFTIEDETQNFRHRIYLRKNAVLEFGASTEKLSLNKWYKIGIILNRYDRTIDYYINGEHYITDTMPAGFWENCGLRHVRFHVRPNSDAPIKFMVDNWRIYEGNELIEDLGEVKNEISLTSKSIFPSDASIIKSLSDYYSIHTRSGVAFANGKKTMLSSMPYEKDGSVYVDADELAKVFGIKTSLNGDVTIEQFAEAANLKTTNLSAVVNNGAVIMGKSAFPVPDDAQKVKELNHYLFYLRPSSEEVFSRYDTSAYKGVHPRICATKEDFDRIREQIKTNSYMKAWSEQVIRAADELLTTDPVIYELRDGVRLLYVSRDVLENMHALGMAYQLTGEQKYVDRAWLDLKAACVDFPDWHPSHCLDTGEMAAAVAIGYDWMYDAFTPEQRAAVEEGIYKHALYVVANAYQNNDKSVGSRVIAEHNWSTVVNGGIALGALALLDVYPEEAAFVVSSSIRAYEYNIVNWAPDGSYFEGSRYWEYALKYAIKYMSTLDTMFGTTFAIDRTEGLDKANDYMLHIQSPNGGFNYGSTDDALIYVPEMFWLAYKYDNAEMASVLMDTTKGKFSDTEDAALALLWLNTDTASSNVNNMPTNKYFPREEVLIMRNGWDEDCSFVAVKGQSSSGDVGHLDLGSFLYDYAGERWALEPGAPNYNVGGYFDTSPNGTRWNIYFARAEAHNTLVINPSDKPDQVVGAVAHVDVRTVKERGAIAVVDTSQLYSDAQSARRGFLYTDNRKSLVIRDEVTLKKDSDVYWFMQTNAKVTTDATGATLTQNGKRIRLDFVSNADATIEVAPGKPLPTSPVIDGDNYGKFNRITIKATGSGAMNITVKLSPYDSAFTPVSDYDKSIDEWTVPDGAIPVAPKLTSLSVGGRDMDITSSFITYNYVDGTLTEVPDISAYSDQYDVTVQKGATLNDISKVIVVDKADLTNKTTYIVSFNALTPPTQFDGFISVPVMAVQVSAEPQLENPASAVFDANLSTRWSASGEGQWITVDIGEVKKLDKAMIAFYDGDVRSTKFAIQVSVDGVNFEEVFRGQSSGTTEDYEFFDIGGKQARYVRLMCYGNTSNAWNSISEIVVAQNK